MDRYLVISSDCHAGLPPQRYREYLDAKYHAAFDAALPIQLELTQKAAKRFLVADINEEWRRGRDSDLAGAWDHDARVRVLDGDGIAGEIIFPDGITEMNMPPFGAGLSLPTEQIVPELQWAGARAHNRWLAELCQMAPERRVGVAIVPALWDVDLAVQEVRWAREHGLRGILIPCMWGKFPAYHHPRYEPLWQACVEHDVVVHFHSGPAPSEEYFGTELTGDGPSLPGAMGIYVSEVVQYMVRPLTFMI
ncbi:MAG TPA: amidohydrolase family protein, partial [Myxococcota bacterium]|nr:amidohydrolase family protein [Myxococcota bacterium]